MNHLTNYFDIKALIMTGAAAAVTIVGIETFIKFIVFGISAGYNLYRWYHAYQDRRKQKLKDDGSIS